MQTRDLVIRLSLVSVFVAGFIFGVEIYALCMAFWVMLNGALRTPNTSFEENDPHQKREPIEIQIRESREQLTALSV